MANITQRYIAVTRAGKQTIQERHVGPRSSEEQRVYEAFRKKAREAYSALRPAGSRG